MKKFLLILAVGAGLGIYFGTTKMGQATVKYSGKVVQNANIAAGKASKAIDALQGD